MRQIKLVDILTEPQIEAVMDIVEKVPDSIERVRKLTAYLETLGDQLEKQEVLPAYLAYIIEHLACGHKPDYSLN